MTPQPIADEKTAYTAYIRRKDAGHISQDTLERYWKYVSDFREWLERAAITPALVDAYHELLCKKYAQNSRIPVGSALNWYFRFKHLRDEDDEPLLLPIPSSQAAENPRLLADDEWPILRKGAADLRELAMAHVVRDTLLRPSDVVATLLQQTRLEQDRPCIIKTQKKTGNPVRAFLTQETADIVRRYIAQYKPEAFLFESEPGNPFHRRWPLETIKRMARDVGLPDDITPRVFRRTGATNWVGDEKDLSLQGGWKDVKTLWKHYRQTKDERHWQAFEKTFEPDKSEATLKRREDDPAFR